MGAWGYGVFENDDAANWAADLEHASNVGVLTQVIGAIVDVQNHLSASDRSHGLALLGRPALELDRIDMNSELKDLRRRLNCPLFLAKPLGCRGRVSSRLGSFESFTE
jgi:hypothetical protein